MALKLETLKRVFKINDDDDDEDNGNGSALPDPNPKLTPEEVMEFYSGSHPELTTARIVGPKWRMVKPYIVLLRIMGRRVDQAKMDSLAFLKYLTKNDIKKVRQNSKVNSRRQMSANMRGFNISVAKALLNALNDSEDTKAWTLPHNGSIAPLP